ncbi:MAG TPA: hypothetical protein DCG51_10055 [Erysipelotrichaceae bacterium]|nr:hypothetical protein [Erysipelotrichaceae bacterium]
MKKELWTKDYIFAVLILFCVHTGPYLLLSVITVYGRLLSGSDTMAGMMASVFALSGLFARFLSAYLLDRVPLKKVLLIFTGLMGLASFLYIFTNTYIQAFLLRGIQGLAYGVTCTAMSTYIVRLLDPQQRLEGIGYSSLTANAANAVCPSIAYALLGPDTDRFKALFLAVFLSVVISFVLMLFMKGSKMESVPAAGKGTGGSGSLVPVMVSFLIWVLMSFAMSSISAFLSLTALQKGFSGIGLYFTFNIAGLILSRILMKKIVQRFGEKAVMIIMICAIAAGLSGISAVTDVRQLYAIGLVIGFANGVLAPVVNTKMINSVPEEKNGFANAVFFAAGDTGFILGPTIWGMAAGTSSYGSVFRLASLTALTAVLILLAGNIHTNKRDQMETI